MWQKIDRAEEARSLAGEIPIHHRYTVGVAGERFFRAMRDERRLLASRCPACKNAFLPPKIYCEECFVETTDWVDVEGPGYVETFTLVHTSLNEETLSPPAVAAMIKWDGIQGGLVHRIEVDDPAKVTVGMAVAPVWAEQRSGSIGDILYFRDAGYFREAKII